MAWDFKLKHKNGTWSFREWDTFWGRCPWMEFKDDEWPMLGRSNYLATLEIQKAQKRKIEKDKRQVQVLLGTVNRVKKVTNDNQWLMSDLYDLLTFVCGGERVKEFGHLKEHLEHGWSLREYKSRESALGLDDRYRYYEEQIAYLDNVINELETVNTQFDDLKTEEDPPLLPFLRNEGTFKVGDEIIVWLRNNPNPDCQVDERYAYPYLTRVMSVQMEEGEELVTAESRYTDELISVCGPWVMAKSEFEYYRNHGSQCKFLMDRLRGSSPFYDILREIRWLIMYGAGCINTSTGF